MFLHKIRVSQRGPKDHDALLGRGEIGPVFPHNGVGVLHLGGNLQNLNVPWAPLDPDSTPVSSPGVSGSARGAKAGPSVASDCSPRAPDDKRCECRPGGVHGRATALLWPPMLCADRLRRGRHERIALFFRPHLGRFRGPHPNRPPKCTWMQCRKTEPTTGELNSRHRCIGALPTWRPSISDRKRRPHLLKAQSPPGPHPSTSG